MNTLWQDLRYGARMLLRKPGFTLIAVITLALGIGANSSIFGLIDKLLLQSLPVKAPAELVLLQAESVNPKLTFSEFSWADYRDYRGQNQVFSELAAFAQQAVNLGSGDQMERVHAELVSENYFDALGVQPAAGRSFSLEENRTPGAHPLAVISHSLWQSRFSGDRQLLGRALELNEASYTIVGIAPPGFKGMNVESPTDIWVPAMMKTELQQMTEADRRDWVSERNYGAFKLLGRLKPGTTKQSGQTAMDTLARQVRDSWMPESDRNLPFNEKHLQLAAAGKGLSAMRDQMGGVFKFLFALVGLILLIACANVANLLLARSASRRKEIAVRLALGAGRWRLTRQLLTESVLLAGLGGAVGLVVAPWLTDLLLFYQARTETAAEALKGTMNWRVLAFTALVSLVTGVLFGLLPALQAASPDLIPALKDEAMLGSDRRSFRVLRRALIVLQVALSVVVLVCAGLFIRSLGKIFAIDPGFNPGNVLVAELQLPMNKYDGDRAEAFYRQLIERLRALPGIESVTKASFTPLCGNYLIQTVVMEGQPLKPNEMPTTDANNVGAGYHELMGIRLLQGRGFTDQDRKGAPAVAIVNEAFARRFFPDGNAYGKRISLGAGMPWIEIIGVTRNVKALSLESEDRSQLDLPIDQQGSGNPMRVLMRTRQDAASLLPAVRREVRAMDSGLAFFKTTTLENDLRNTLSMDRMVATLSTLFGALALVLAAMGLYGIIAYSVDHRTREIGIRMALGAQNADVLWLVMREGLLLIAAGLVIGLVAALASTRLIESHLYNVRSTDPVTFAVILALLSAVALLACYLPARRAVKVDPMVALRTE